MHKKFSIKIIETESDGMWDKPYVFGMAPIKREGDRVYIDGHSFPNAKWLKEEEVIGYKVTYDD